MCGNENKKTIIVSLVILSIWVNSPITISESYPVDDFSESAIELRTLIGDIFCQNNGQIPNPDVIFYSNNAYFTSTGIIFRVLEPVIYKPPNPPFNLQDSLAMNPLVKMHIFRTTFIGANNVIPYGQKELPFRSNFFISTNQNGWATDVPNYEEIIYENLYDDIDMIYKVVPDGLKYEFIVHPGGNVEDIAILYDGADIWTDGTSIFINTSRTWGWTCKVRQIRR